MRNSADWHARFTQQAAWTRNLREYLYRAAGLDRARRVLEAGCGTGAILSDLPAYTAADVFGIDINREHLRLAQSASPDARLTAADVFSLPFPNAFFDVTLCHFFLLWVAPPEAAAAEMARVTRSGGFVLALAEPDYSSRIDYPDSLSKIGYAQIDALRQQGADPHIGRRLPSLFIRPGLKLLRSGILGAEWQPAADPAQRELEWRVLEDDLRGAIPTEELARLREMDETAWQRGERVLFVPTFFALAQVE